MMKYILWGIIFYFLIRFIFNFLIPVIRTAAQMRKQMRQFQDKMAGEQVEDNMQPHGNSKAGTRPKSEDYIDFEEVK